MHISGYWFSLITNIRQIDAKIKLSHTSYLLSVDVIGLFFPPPRLSQIFDLVARKANMMIMWVM